LVDGDADVFHVSYRGSPPAILATGQPIIGVEINGQRPDTADRFWSTYWHPLKDSQGVVIGINVAAEEITDRKRAQAALLTNEERLRELANTLAERVADRARERDRIWNVSQDLMVVADTDGRIVGINPAWTTTLDWLESDLIGKTAEWLVHPDDLERTLAELKSLVAGHKTTQFQNRLRRRSGAYSWLSWRAVLDRDVIFAVARDITELKQAEEQLRISQIGSCLAANNNGLHDGIDCARGQPAVGGDRCKCQCCIALARTTRARPWRGSCRTCANNR
jgi:PAS domain S-box-containing protein